MNIGRPPFQIISGQSAQDAAVDIVAAFKSIEHLPNKVSLTFTTIINQLDLDPRCPLVSAGINLAQAVDTEAVADNNPYHNSQHYCEVMLCSYFLSLLSGMDEQAIAEIALAALIHDYRHDGKLNGDIPFRLERKAINEVLPYLVMAKAEQAQQQCLATLVLSTEPLHGVNIVRMCYLHHTQGHSLPEIHAAAIELEQLGNDPITSKQALILCEADILPSVGLTIEHALLLQDKLSLEWGVRLGPEDKLRFIDQNCYAFVAAGFFDDNVVKLRQAILLQLENQPDEI